MGKQSKRKFSSDFKAEVVFEAPKERNTIQELAKKYELHPNRITTWKKEFLSNARTVFENSKNELILEDNEKVKKESNFQKQIQLNSRPKWS